MFRIIFCAFKFRKLIKLNCIRSYVWNFFRLERNLLCFLLFVSYSYFHWYLIKLVKLKDKGSLFTDIRFLNQNPFLLMKFIDFISKWSDGIFFVLFCYKESRYSSDKYLRVITHILRHTLCL